MVRRSRGRQVAFGFTLLAMIGIVTLLVVEVALRLSGRVTVEGIRSVSASQYETSPGMFTPNQDVMESPRAELTHHATTNSFGLRGQVPSKLEKSPGVQRVLCLGDSFTYGSYVDDEDTLPGQLQHRFNDAGSKVEVINGGLGGTTITDQLVFLERMRPLQPDLVLLTFSENDVADLDRFEPLHISLAKNRAIKSSGVIGFFYRNFADTAIFNFALQIRANLSARFTDHPSPPPTDGPRGEEQERLERVRTEQWERYAEGLETFRLMVEEMGARMAFATYPSHYRIGPTSHLPSLDPDRLERVEGIARRLRIPTISLLPAIKASGLDRTDLYLLPWDGHPSPAGYRVASTKLHDALTAILVDER